MYARLILKPGVNQDKTRYANGSALGAGQYADVQGGWWDCSNVRFRAGMPEKLGGWESQILEPAQYFYTPDVVPFGYLGVCRSLIEWTTLAGATMLGVGTNTRYYTIQHNYMTDITPVRATATLTNPLNVTPGSPYVIVNDPDHGVETGDVVTFVSVEYAAGTFAAAEFIRPFYATKIDGSNFKILMPAPEGSFLPPSPGGGAVVITYPINSGGASNFYGDGWGAGPYSRNGYGEPADTEVQGATMRLWSSDNFGEDLLICPRGGQIYYWDATDPASPAVALSELDGASDTPLYVNEVMSSDQARHVIAFGANPQGSTVQDRLLIRFSSAEDPAMWTAQTTNSAGDLRLSTGSEIVTALQTRQEILIWTDVSLYSMQYIGAPFYFGLTTLASNISIYGPNAKVSVNDTTYWMGNGSFYVYDGRTKELECPILDYVFNDITTIQQEKVYAGSNAAFSEVWWFYPSADSDENDKYVIYNYDDKAWSFGELSRTAWLDAGVTQYPRGAYQIESPGYHSAGGIMRHEYGMDADDEAMESYIVSSPIEIGDGEHFSFVKRIVPDVTFRNSDASTKVMISLTPQNQPGSADGTPYSKDVSRVTVTQFTPLLDIRVRGRSVVFQIESDDLGVSWRLGTPRLELQKDGRR